MKRVRSIRIRVVKIVTDCLVLGLLLPCLVHAQDIYDWTEDDYALYPSFCRVKLKNGPPAEISRWSKQMGSENFMHMHHYCAGLKAMSLAYANHADKQVRNSYVKLVVGEMKYVLTHTNEDFYMRPDVLITLGRGYQLWNDGEKARGAFEQALKLKPDAVDAWVALSDLYYDNGQRNEALKVLEQARAHAGDHRKIMLRIEQMPKK